MFLTIINSKEIYKDTDLVNFTSNGSWHFNEKDFQSTASEQNNRSTSLSTEIPTNAIMQVSGTLIPLKCPNQKYKAMRNISVGLWL